MWVILLVCPVWTVCQEPMWVILVFCPFGPVFYCTYRTHLDTHLSTLIWLVRLSRLFEAHRLVDKAPSLGDFSRQQGTSIFRPGTVLISPVILCAGERQDRRAKAHRSDLLSAPSLLARGGYAVAFLPFDAR
jgi:hypothetical protein